MQLPLGKSCLDSQNGGIIFQVYPLQTSTDILNWYLCVSDKNTLEVTC